MRQSKGYILKTIAGVPYVLPFGQNIADHKRGVELNETGVFLWKTLEQEMSVGELLDKFLKEILFDGSEQEKAEIQQDINVFVNQLVHFGILEEEVAKNEEPLWRYVKIGGLTMKLSGPAEVFSEEFEPFGVAEEMSLEEMKSFRGSMESVKDADLTIEVHYGIPQKHANGQVLLRNQELVICEREEDYLLLFPEASQIVEASLRKSGDYAEFYCQPPCTEQLQYDLFHAIRLVYLYLAQKNGMYALHSASILYRGKAWLFSGPSGTGKSTHTNLWKEAFDTPMINGDLNLLALNKEGAVIHGMPWCGTSKISDTSTYPLGGIILLKQYPEDKIVELPEDKQALHVMQRMISPAWTGVMVEQNVEFAEKLVKTIYVGRLLCTKERSAAEVMKARIDRLTKEKVDD